MATQSISSFFCAHHLGKDRDDPRSHVTIQYIQGVLEAVARILSDINVQVHMKPFKTLRRILFHLKDHISDDDKSSVVYKINCRDCDASYVGRALKTHMSEHCRAVEKMKFSASALAQHVLEHNHHTAWTALCVLGVESHYWSRLSREAIYIHRQPSSLNRNRRYLASSLNRNRLTLPDVYDYVIL